MQIVGKKEVLEKNIENKNIGNKYIYGIRKIQIVEKKLRQ